MILKNIVLLVNNIDKSKYFYQELFQLQIRNDLGKKVILSQGIVLQERGIKEQESYDLLRIQEGGSAYLEKGVLFYFEESNLEDFLDRIMKYEADTLESISETLTKHVDGNREYFLLHDLDGHSIEVSKLWC